jgi:hypothetical protein
MLGKVLICCIVLSTSISAFAQSDPFDSSKVQLEDIEVSFLSSYYQQDGNNSPVTGGSGTEYLTNLAPSLNVLIPLDSNRKVILDGGVDFYSSASSDNIDNPDQVADYVSGASGRDERSYVSGVYKKKINKNLELGYLAGGSFEWDVFSYYGGVSLGLSSEDNNRGLDVKANVYYDDWKLIYPAELRNGNVQYLDEDKRISLNTSLVFSANLTKRLAASIATDLVVQDGLLSTPFHRVYFEGAERAVVEQLPSSRVKYPVGLRLNYHVTDFLILKTFYRYYVDSWGLTANTFELTMPIKVSQSLRVYPFYRLLMQNEIDYFKPIGEHLSTSEFYTSDYDLSTFDSNKYGLGFTYTPLFGLGHFKYHKGRLATFKSISLRYAHYDRSDGLTADVVTIGLQFNLKR